MYLSSKWENEVENENRKPIIHVCSASMTADQGVHTKWHIHTHTFVAESQYKVKM